MSRFTYDVGIAYEVGRRIRGLRTQRGLTMDALGKLCGTMSGTISHYEMGQHCPSVESLMRLSHALECDPCDLLPSAIWWAERQDERKAAVG